MKKEKGLFSRLGLTVSRSYVQSTARPALIWAGAILGIVASALLALDFLVLDATVLSNGKLSSNHAFLEKDCSSCHTPLRSVSDDKCGACHERFTQDARKYTLAAHFVYRSDDPERSEGTHGEVRCSACHLEHRGRQTALTSVSDDRCLGCHSFGSFDTSHPPFDIHSGEKVVRSGLRFTHIRHVEETERRFGVSTEDSCSSCHAPDKDGRHFAPLDFQRHCDGCHLTRGTHTPVLPLVSSDDESGGVRDWEAGGDGVEFPCRVAPEERDFETPSPGQIRKTRLQHEDCWILANLRRLRRQALPDLGLADLLVTWPEEPLESEDLRSRYLQVIETIKHRSQRIRRSGIHSSLDDLNDLDAVLRQAEYLTTQTGMISSSRALLPSLSRSGDDSTLDRALRRSLELLALIRPDDAVPAMQGSLETRGESSAAVELANLLSKPCQRCHLTTSTEGAGAFAGFAPVRSGLRSLSRARFDHQSHKLQRSCLACHSGLLDPDPRLDLLPPQQMALKYAEKHNIPTIDECRSCHNSQQVSNRCSSCHDFHPAKDRRLFRPPVRPLQSRTDGRARLDGR